jgi:hypothetical protein
MAHLVEEGADGIDASAHDPSSSVMLLGRTIGWSARMRLVRVVNIRGVAHVTCRVALIAVGRPPRVWGGGCPTGDARQLGGCAE